MRVKFCYARKLEMAMNAIVDVALGAVDWFVGWRMSQVCCCYIDKKILPSLYSIGFRSFSDSFKCGQSVTLKQIMTDFGFEKRDFFCVERRAKTFPDKTGLGRFFINVFFFFF